MDFSEGRCCTGSLRQLTQERKEAWQRYSQIHEYDSCFKAEDNVAPSSWSTSNSNVFNLPDSLSVKPDHRPVAARQRAAVPCLAVLCRPLSLFWIVAKEKLLAKSVRQCEALLRSQAYWNWACVWCICAVAVLEKDFHLVLVQVCGAREFDGRASSSAKIRKVFESCSRPKDFISILFKMFRQNGCSTNFEHSIFEIHVKFFDHCPHYSKTK